MRSAVVNGNWDTVAELSASLASARQASPPSDSRKVFLVTGGAGFIGSHLVRRLLAEGHRVIVFDDFNDYYDPALKYENISDLLGQDAFELFETDVRDDESMRSFLSGRRVDVIVHLAARAGVRSSVVDPALYVTTNVLGTQNLLDLAREHAVACFVYASSSSVYGETSEQPFHESQRIDHPISPYAATKRANEGQAACYSHLYRLPVVGLRFFSVYGPSGRPDMAIRQFIEKLDRGEPITVFGDGSFERDFTYIDDIVSGIFGAIEASRDRPGFNDVFNLGESDTISVRELVLLIASELGLVRPARDVLSLADHETSALFEELSSRGLIDRRPEQPGDVHRTYADVTKSREALGYAPAVPIAEGLKRTIAWHRTRKSLANDVSNAPLLEAIRVLSGLCRRSALDSFGREQDPGYVENDALSAASAIRLIARCDSPAVAALALHVRIGLARRLEKIASALLNR
ncbi:MAG: GDP-mannose 4,6-dehydratase [Vicinamibacteria bacterium]|nr:GDP-mannose 4,6-dehydratase [Vicinamibacteria bacterium]